MVGTDFFVNVKTANTFKYNYCTHFLRCPKYEQFIVHLSHYKTMFPFYTSGKHQKTFKFLTLLGGYKMQYFSWWKSERIPHYLKFNKSFLPTNSVQIFRRGETPHLHSRSLFLVTFYHR